jgi:serine/threonine protein kinase
MVEYDDVLFVLERIGRIHDGNLFQHSADRCAVEVKDNDGNKSMVKITGFEVPKKKDKAEGVLKDIDEEMGILKTLQELTAEGKNSHNILKVQHSGKEKRGRKVLVWTESPLCRFDLEDLIGAAEDIENIDPNNTDLVRAAKILNEHRAEVAVQASTQMADALKYAYDEKKLIHRDVKTMNSVVGHIGLKKEKGSDKEKVDFQSYLIDFQTATWENRPVIFTSTGVKGTNHYIPPEEGLGIKNITPSRDTYAIGVALYQILTLTRQRDLNNLDYIEDDYAVAQANQERFYQYLGLEPVPKEVSESEEQSENEKGFEYAIDNIIFREIVKKCLAFDIQFKQKGVDPWHERYQTMDELLADLRVIELNDEYEQIKKSLDVDINDYARSADSRELAQSTWRTAFVLLQYLNPPNNDFDRRRGKNWLLDKFEDEYIAKRVNEDRITIEATYIKLKEEVLTEEDRGKRLKKGQKLSAYARIWKAHEDWLKGYKGDVKVHASTLTSENIEDLATNYDRNKKIKQIKGAPIKNEANIKNLEGELLQYEELLGENAVFQKKRREIETYRKKVEEACDRAKKTYDEQQTPRKFNPDALKNALKVLGDPRKYGDKGQYDVQGFYQVAAARFELVHSDRILRKWSGADDSEEEVGEAFQVPDFMRGQLWVFDANVAAILSKLAEHQKIGASDYERAREGTLEIPKGQEKAFADVRLQVRINRPGATKEDIYAAMKEYVEATDEEKDRELLDKFEKENHLGKYAPFTSGDFLGE